MKTKEEILAKRIIRFPAGDRRLAAGAMTDEAIKRNVYAAMEEYAAQFKDSPYQAGSAGVWRSDQAPELVDGKKAIPRHVIAEKKTHDGKTYKSKRVAYYFPERFKSVEFEDWDDYDPKDFPYTTQDEEKGVVWLKAGWYESVNCDRCDEYWSAPLDVIEWLDESISSPAGDGWTPLTSGNPLPDYDEPMLWITESGNQFVQALDKDESIQCFRDATKATHYRPLPSPPNKSA